MRKDSRIFVAGHLGLAGSAIVRRLQQEGYTNLLLRSRRELDLTDAAAVRTFFEITRPEYVFVAAAKVGGILANSSYPAEFIYDNLAIETNVIHHAYRCGAEKLLFLGSSCIYPKYAPQPMKEESLLAGALEPTNEPYAVAKIAGIKMVEAYRKQYGFNGISLMPTNLYGPGDNYDLQTSHVLPALLRKIHEAHTAGERVVTIWGTGTPRREFLFVDDLADASVFLMNNYDSSDIINVGTGEDVTIHHLAELIAAVVGFRGSIIYDTSKPDGTPRKLLDVSRLRALGWAARTSLKQGIVETYHEYIVQTKGRELTHSYKSLSF
ncbi:MAG: GDP-L-fucose synthase [Bryobacteraceae bacterium]